MPGKTPGHYSQVLVNGYDESGSAHGATLSSMFPEVDGTGLSNAQHGVMAGIPQVTANIKFWLDAGAGGGHVLLSAGAGNYVVAVPHGVGAVPVASDAMFAAVLQLNSYLSELEIATAVGVTAQFANGPAAGATGIAIGKPWGLVLQPNAHKTSTTNGTIVDWGAASANGAMGVLHVTLAGGTWAIKITHDTASNMATETTLMTFASNGTAITGEMLIATGTVNRYTRAVMTRTSGNFDGFVGLVRG